MNINKAFKHAGHEIEHTANKVGHEIKKVATSDAVKEIGEVALDIAENPQVQQAVIDVAVAAI
jgi:hypothetical protein